MSGGAIAAAVIGATTEALATAASMAQNAIKDSKSNLATSIEVWNGTAYDFNVIRTKFRKGALAGGIEGTFIESPGLLGQQSFSVFSVEQNHATTDVVGAVLYTSSVIDLLVGFHIFDKYGYQRYITAVPLIKGTGEALFDANWDAWEIDERLNKYIWSGGGRTNEYSTKDTKYQVLDYDGHFIRDIRERDQKGDLVATMQGTPSIRQIDAYGHPGFVALYTGGAKIMKVILSDDAFSQEIVDITGQWQDENDEQSKFDVAFVDVGIKISDGNTPVVYTRDDDANLYVDKLSGDSLEFQPKIAIKRKKTGEVTTFHRAAEK